MKTEGRFGQDSDLRGGSLVVQGPCDSNGCGHDRALRSLVLNGGAFDVKSGGAVAVAATDPGPGNVPGSSVLLRSGSGTSTVGGDGGDLFAFAGDSAAGEARRHFHSL